MAMEGQLDLNGEYFANSKKYKEMIAFNLPPDYPGYGSSPAVDQKFKVW